MLPWADPLLGRQPLPSWADTPSLGRHPRADTPLLGRHPPPGQTPPSWADTPLLGRHPPPGQTSPWAAPHWADTPPPRWLLQRTLGILLECILVFIDYGLVHYINSSFFMKTYHIRQLVDCTVCLVDLTVTIV